MSKDYVLAIDQGTTSSRAVIYNKNGQIIDKENIEFRQIYPHPGWVEHDPEDIFNSVMEAIKIVFLRNSIGWQNIDSIGITNQRETTIMWEKTTGKPIYNGICLQCRRTSDRCLQIKKSVYNDLIFDKTGLVVDPYFSATKAEWIINNVDGVRDSIKRNEICFGTVDSYIIYRLTSGTFHVTDYSNASRTMLFNIHTMDWDQELLTFFKIPRSILPTAVENTPDNIYTAPAVTGGVSVRIGGIIGDQQGALFGQRCFEEGDIKNTYGTGCFLLMNTGRKAMKSSNKLLTTVAWKINGTVTYALEGAVFIGGAVVQWLRDGISIIEKSSDTEKTAYSTNNDSVIFIPAFSGLGTPYWDPEVRGAILGLTRDTGRAEIVKAALESIAYQTVDLVSAMKQDIGGAVGHFNTDGGASVNKYLMQFQADLLQEKLSVMTMNETTSLGAAYLAGLSTGFYSMESIMNFKSDSINYIPSITSEKARFLYSRWEKAVSAVREFKIF